MTTIYLIRHSQPLKVNNELNSDSLQIQNEKFSLSIEGEQIAQNIMNNPTSWDKLPEQFERRQFLDENYKIGNGENQKEARDRMLSAITKILKENKSKNIAIVSHGTSISYLLKKWCNVEIIDDKLR